MNTHNISRTSILRCKQSKRNYTKAGRPTAKTHQGCCSLWLFRGLSCQKPHTSMCLHIERLNIFSFTKTSQFDSFDR